MPAETSHNLIWLGRQPVVSLPRSWVKFWRLKKQEPLPIFYNSILVIIPPTHPHREKLESRIRNLLIENEQEGD